MESELAQAISDALLDADIPYGVTISRTVVIPPANPWEEGTETTTTFECKGFIETFEAEYVAGGLVQGNDLKVVILAPTLTTSLLLSDLVTVRAQTFSIVRIMPDPALATIALQVRV